jgi:hypothetical protein
MPLQEGLKRCGGCHLHSRFDERPDLRAARRTIDHILQLVFYRVGEHRRAFRNMGLRCADKLSLLGRRSLSKHARCNVDK